MKYSPLDATIYRKIYIVKNLKKTNQLLVFKAKIQALRYLKRIMTELTYAELENMIYEDYLFRSYRGSNITSNRIYYMYRPKSTKAEFFFTYEDACDLHEEFYLFASEVEKEADIFFADFRDGFTVINTNTEHFN